MHISVRRIIITIIILILGLIIFFFLNRVPEDNIKEKIYMGLAEIRDNKKNEIIKYFENLKILSEGIKDEPEIVQLFNQLKKITREMDSELENRINLLYSEKYYKFYDILFIDIDGYIFHSIKREADYQTNFFTGKFSKTELAGSVIESNEAVFVDYNYYMPSEEPASFFVIPVRNNGRQTGWIVLQIPLNRVNIILTGKMNNLRTTEVYLINNKNIMLSDSRFYKDSTAMKLKISSYAVQSTFEKSRGERILNDYRNISVLSSFEEFEMFGAGWKIIAEIDEDEVITEYYKKNKKYLIKEIIKSIEKEGVKSAISLNNIVHGGRVDIGEYQRGGQSVFLWTIGVGTCTAVSVLYPERFGYLSHISPVDDIYISGRLTKYFLGDNNTDLLGDILRKINKFEILPSEKRELEFSLAAIHSNSLEKTVDKILENGYELSNITFLYNPQMKDVNVQLDLAKNQINLNWSDGIRQFYNTDADYPDLGEIVKEIIDFKN